MKKCSISVAEFNGKVSRSNYFEKIANIRTINTPTGIIQTNGVEVNFIQKTVPLSQEPMKVLDLEEQISIKQETDNNNIKINTLMSNSKYGTVKDKNHHVTISNKRLLNDLINAPTQRKKSIASIIQNK